MSDFSSPLITKAFAPVNIAWIKYMGKNSGLPTNSSLSLTLATLGTHTTMMAAHEVSNLSFEWDPTGYVPPMTGQKKAEDFLLNKNLWIELLTQFNFECLFPQSKISIKTSNNVPAGTGIATSASAFAALTLAWSAILAGPRQQEWIKLVQSGEVRLRKAMAKVAAKGSGSSCRSLDGPWVEWNPEQGISVIDGGPTEWMDFIFLIESGPKQVPSSEAHQRVITSPHFQERAGRAEKRLAHLKALLKGNPNTIPQIQSLVLEEAMDMHDLFHTSQPPFRYMTSLSEEIASSSQLPSFKGVVTLDAGANVHLFVPLDQEHACESWIKSTYPEVKYLKDIAGYGAHYEE